MDQEELDLCQCVFCGAGINALADRYFASSDSDDSILCFECAIERGGQYDEDSNLWLVLPDVSSLPDQRRPHA